MVRLWNTGLDSSSEQSQTCAAKSGLHMDCRCLLRKTIKCGVREARAPADEPDVCQMEAVRTFLSGTSEILIRHRAINAPPDPRCSGINEITALAAFGFLLLTKVCLLLISALISTSSNLRLEGPPFWAGLKRVKETFLLLAAKKPQLLSKSPAIVFLHFHQKRFIHPFF